MKRFFLPVFVLFVSAPFIFCGNTTPEVKQQSLPAASVPDEDIKATGMIAYIRNSSEIRLIDSNGQNDRQIWTHPHAKGTLGIYDLAWRPDGKELAFSSGHEAVYSLYHADIYGIRPDGSGYRKITNSPDHKSLSKFKKGTVSVTVRNNQYTFDAAQSSAGVFIVNIIGAEEAQQITLPPGTSKTLVFKNVADFGNSLQPLVATYGNYRWFMPGTDVAAGKNIKAPDFIISGDGIPYFGAFRPIWNNDGSKLSYRDGLCQVMTIPVNPPVGEVHYQSMFGENYPQGSCVWDWNPSLKDEVLYSENENEEGSGFYVTKEGGDHDPSKRLTWFNDIKYQIANDVRWLPDASGFLYSSTSHDKNDGSLQSNIFLFDMATKQTRQVTKLKDSYARRFCISPSGKWIVYERCKKGAGDDESYGVDLQLIEDVDLWMVRADGTGEKLLVKNAQGPSWSR